MKSCPICHEQYEDELNFCTFDGTALRARSASRKAVAASGSLHNRTTTQLNTLQMQSSPYSSAPRSNGWKIAFFTLLFFVLIGVAGFFLYFSRWHNSPPVSPLPKAAAAIDSGVKEIPKEQPEPEKAVSLAEMSQKQLLEILPKNLLRRFHAGESNQGTPDDMRVITEEKGEYVVLVGAGKLDTKPAERVLILSYDGSEFQDVTRQVMPKAYATGVVTGNHAQVEFEGSNTNLVVRETASSRSIIDECATCEHAYQQVTFEWKDGHYIESARAWDNDRYTAFYVVAEALEKRKVDARARPLIDKSLDAVIARGFLRNGKEPWSVESRADNESEVAEYGLSNGAQQLIVTLSKVKGSWKATRIEEN